MTLVDSEINQLIDKGILKNAKNKPGSISYDLTVKEIIPTNTSKQRGSLFQLNPQDVVFIACEEDIYLTNNLIAFVEQRNSRIRQGLVIDAPVYQPGHATKVFFRVRNISSDRITIKQGDSIASIRFEWLSKEPDFRNLGNYENILKSDVEKVEKKIEDVELLEKNIYGNVMTLMTIFIGIFSLINLNIGFLQNNSFNIISLLTYNLIVIGTLGLFAGLISLFLPRHNVNRLLFIIPSLLLIIALGIACIL